MRVLIAILIGLFFVSCENNKAKNYSFFIAGHTYGSPKDKGKTKGLYTNFKNKIPLLNEKKTLELGFLLGDVVWKPSSWPEAIKDIQKINVPVHIARGNHDGPLKEFEEQFGKSFKSILKNNDLFIVLDPNLDRWNISNDQLVFLMNAIRNNKNINHIFILTHQLIWWTNNKYSKPFPNSIQGKAPKINYWSKIEPLLQDLEVPVYLFAGDVGAFSKEDRKANFPTEYFYHVDKNITYVATGMGGGVRDNFVIINVEKNGDVNFDLIHLNGDDINSLGILEDYVNPNK